MLLGGSFPPPSICLNIPMLKGAFIGCADAFNLGPAVFTGEGFELTAFCPAAPGSGIPVQAALPQARAYGDFKTLLSEEAGLEFAAVSLPPEKSSAAVLLALEQGLHVFCDPPLCFSMTEFETLRTAAEIAGKTLFPSQPWEHAAPWLALNSAITRGLAGEINYAEVQALSPGPEPEGGAAAAMGWQAISMLLAMVRRPPAAVEARLAPGTAAAFHAHFRGADGFAHLSCGSHAPRLRAAVSGDKGRLEMDGNLLRLDLNDMEPETVELRHALVPGVCRPEWLAAELSDFKKEMAGQRPRGTGLRNSRYCVKLLRNASYSASVKSAAIPL